MGQISLETSKCIFCKNPLGPNEKNQFHKECKEMFKELVYEKKTSHYQFYKRILDNFTSGNISSMQFPFDESLIYFEECEIETYLPVFPQEKQVKEKIKDLRQQITQLQGELNNDS